MSMTHTPRKHCSLAAAAAEDDGFKEGQSASVLHSRSGASVHSAPVPPQPSDSDVDDDDDDEDTPGALLRICEAYTSCGYLEDPQLPSHMGTLPTENWAAGFSEAAASCRIHGTSKGVDEQRSWPLAKSASS